MGLRDIVLTAVVFGLLPVILRRPWIGVLTWAWLGLMNPHRMAWGFAYSMPFSQIVALTTLGALLFSSEKKSFPRNGVIVIWVIFILWMCITTVFALVPDNAWPEWSRTMKIQLFAFITLLLINTRERLHLYVIVVTFSIAFFGIKGGVFVLGTGGNYMVMGPEGSFISGNNSIALALIMVLPLMRYIQLQVKQRWMIHALSVGMGLSALSILASYSRGAIVALAVMGMFLIAKTRKKAWLVLALALAIPLTLAFLPEKWYSRVETIENYEEDVSLQGRFNAWWFAFHLANDRPLVGGGFRAFDRALFYQYAPDPRNYRDAHSIYFEMLGEHGYVGLFLFLLLGSVGLYNGTAIIRKTRDRPDLAWARDLARMTQVAGIGYAAGGVFLGLAYFDLYYALLAILVITRSIVERTQEPAGVNETQALPRRNIFARAGSDGGSKLRRSSP
ncbi:MAG: putative O-glycosylation ligase, exosortase A system-associated [Chromatiales bacterium]|nr:putative O-glycosylation ligase, exosortase A system-associated [Chromatiales bacterium]